MTRKIEAVLEKVKDPESQLPIAQIGLVEKISYSAENKQIGDVGSETTYFLKAKG